MKWNEVLGSDPETIVTRREEGRAFMREVAVMANDLVHVGPIFPHGARIEPIDGVHSDAHGHTGRYTAQNK